MYSVVSGMLGILLSACRVEQATESPETYILYTINFRTIKYFACMQLACSVRAKKMSLLSICRLVGVVPLRSAACRHGSKEVS